jgi:hypothetical protein
MENDAKRRWLLFVVSAALVSLPYLVVTFPPATDLPQHVAQVRLFLDQWQSPDPGYRIQLLTPYNLGYALMGVLYYLVGPIATGRAALLVVALMWTGAIHCLAARRRLSAAGAVLATTFVFNFTFYWGLYNFVFGFPFFVVWLLLTIDSDRDEFTAKDGLMLFLTALALYFSHAFWFAAAVGWLALATEMRLASRRVAMLRIASVAPVAILAVVWYVGFSRTWYATPGATIEKGSLDTKLNWNWWVETALGGVSSDAEIVVVLLAVAWVAGAMWRYRKNLAEAIDVPVAMCAAMFAAVTIVAPYNFQNTIFFGERWLPIAFILAILAVPVPVTLSRPGTLQAAALGVLLTFSLSTSLLWTRFESIENTGLTTALEALPPKKRVLGLDYIKLSTCVRNYPFMQMPAYAQAVKGAELSSSFAALPHSLVTYDTRVRPQPEWTPQLEWFADNIKTSDFKYFDYALVYADEGTHRVITERYPIASVTSDGRWRLYEIQHGS